MDTPCYVKAARALKMIMYRKIYAEGPKQKRHILRCVFEITLRFVLVSLMKCAAGM